MIPKNTAAAALTNNCATGFQSLTSSPLRARIPPCRRTSQRRRFASSKKDQAARDDEAGGGTSQNEGIQPPQWPSKSHPTPYDIFAIPRSAPYTKKRFYQLVKLYHPDLSTQHAPSSSSVLSHTIRLERYRLVVAANDLLSDPSKRKLYDAHGLGWHLPGTAPPLRDIDKSWRHQPNSPAMNATWEDWERWYEARDGHQRRQPTYMSNGVFATLVVMTVLVGAVAQSQRAGRAGNSYLEQTDARHAAVGEQVRKSAVAAAGMKRDERVDRFLRDRENVAYQFNPAVYESQLAGDRKDAEAKVPRIVE